MAGRWTRRRVAGALIVLTLVGAIGGAVALRAAKKADGGPDGRDKAPQVTLEFAPADIVRVEALPLARWLPVSGALQPVRQATVKSKVSGDVRQINVREGEPVQAGQVLVRIDSADLEVKLAERVGALESAKAQLALAEKTRATNLTLLHQNFISQNAFDNSESSFKVSTGTVKSAEAQVQLARNALRDAIVTAPLSGTVAKRHVQPGEKVAFDAPLVTVVDLRDLELQAMVPAGDVPALALGMPVELAVDGFGERRFNGRVERISPATEPGTRAILVFVGIPNPDGLLRGGMFATGRIALAAQAAAPTLPLAALRTEAGLTYVWVIDAGKLAKRSVAVGRRDDEAGRVELKTPLPAELPILAARFDNLKEGAPARVSDPAPAPAAASPAKAG
jgi:membrane fusion protein (multidrug efflux system)